MALTFEIKISKVSFEEGTFKLPLNGWKQTTFTLLL